MPGPLALPFLGMALGLGLGGAPMPWEPKPQRSMSVNDMLRQLRGLDPEHQSEEIENLAAEFDWPEPMLRQRFANLDEEPDARPATPRHASSGWMPPFLSSFLGGL